MTWQEEVAALLASVPESVRRKFDERLAQLSELESLRERVAELEGNELNMRYEAAVYALELLTQANYRAQEVLSQAGLELAAHREQERKRQLDQAMIDATYPLDAALTELRAAIAKGLESGVSKRTLREIWDEAEAQHRERQEVQAFTDAAARDVLKNTEWTETSVNLAQETMDALAGIKKGKGKKR